MMCRSISRALSLMVAGCVLATTCLPLGHASGVSGLEHNSAAISETRWPNAATCNDRWLDGSPANGIGGWVNAIAVDSAGHVYAGGAFKAAGDKLVNNIAKWDGTSWHPLGSGVDQAVDSIVIIGTDVYAGGYFKNAGGQPAKHIAKWDGSTWSQVGSGLEYPVFDMAVSGSTIYTAGGAFSDTSPLIGVVSVWNGSAWSALGSSTNFPVTSVAVSGSDVYAGGNFQFVGGVAANRIIKWTGTGWSNIGTGLDAGFSDLAVSGGDVYVAAAQSIAGGGLRSLILKRTGSAWTQIGSVLHLDGRGSAHVNSLAVSGTDVYIVGQFTTTNGIYTPGFAKFDGSTWSAVGSWTGYSLTVSVDGPNVYLGGSTFTSPGYVPRADGIAKWNGSSWSAFGQGKYAIPDVFARSGNDVYAAGYFTDDGGETVSRVAKWNGSGWIPIDQWPTNPSGAQPYIAALAVSGTDIYIGGRSYYPATDTHRGFVMRWNGGAWSELGSGMTSTYLYPPAGVNALAFIGNDLYAGGSFTDAGGTAANMIAKWNGSNWSPLGTGTSSNVLALAVSGNDLYVGGEFNLAGGIAANRIAKWNGSTWSALGEGPMGSEEARVLSPDSGFYGVTDITIAGNDVYAAGGKDMFDYDDYAFVSKWNGTSWSSLLFMHYYVSSIALSDSEIFSVGGFDNESILKWNGTAWTSIGFNQAWGPTKVFTSGNQLFVSGGFYAAGCHVSSYFARYLLAPEVSVSGRVLTATGAPIRNAAVTITDPAGVTRSTITSTFGSYSFDDVAAGQTYALRASAKRFRFQAVQRTISDNLTDLDLIAGQLEQ